MLNHVVINYCMNIGILSRGPQLYSTQSLVNACLYRGHFVQVIDHAQCSLLIDQGAPALLYEGRSLRFLDAVIPRIGASVTRQGAAVISQFETIGVFTTTKSDALLQTRDKLRCLQKLTTHGLDTPKTAFAGEGQNLVEMIDAIGGFPVVIKLLEGTHGIGVLLAETFSQAQSIIEMLLQLGERVMIQEFIRESKGSDIRAFVVNGKVVASMRRQAKEGEFRSNLHRGGSADPVELTEEEVFVVTQASKIMGLDIAGVDILRSYRGPLIMEVNASPGLEGIENVTGVNVSGSIVQFLESNIEVFEPMRASSE